MIGGGVGAMGDSLYKMVVADRTVQLSFAKSYGDKVSSNAGNFKDIGDNKRANQIAQQYGYKGAEDLKKAYIGEKAPTSPWNMGYDKKTSEIIIYKKSDRSVNIATGLYIR